MSKNDRKLVDFDKVVADRCEKIHNVLAIKAKEYQRNDNRFHNFEVGADMTGQSALRVLDGFMLKHLISYRDIINDIEQGNMPTEALIDEKFGDIINYFILQEGQIKQMLLNNG